MDDPFNRPPDRVKPARRKIKPHFGLIVDGIFRL
jgi:hypothetical protein